MRHTSDGLHIDHIALAILRRDGQMVLVQQRGTEDDVLYWVVPGGLVEPGELIIDALVREVLEEAGVQVAGGARLICVSQIDRPAHNMQTIAFFFEVGEWHGSMVGNDPDKEVVRTELLPSQEAIERLAANGGWPGIQGPMLAYLRGEHTPGSLYFYREEAGVQRLLSRVEL